VQAVKDAKTRVDAQVSDTIENGMNNSAAKEASEVENDQKQRDSKRKIAKEKKEQECIDSHDMRKDCGVTYTQIENAERMKRLGETTAAGSVQLRGQQGVSRAVESGKQSTVFRESAATMDLAGRQSAALGLMRTLTGSKLSKKSNAHHALGKNLEANHALLTEELQKSQADLETAETLAKGLHPRNNPNNPNAVRQHAEAMKRVKAIKVNMARIKNDIKLYEGASGEQYKVSGEAAVAAGRETDEGLFQLLSGVSAMNAARQQRDEAKKLEQADKNGNVKPPGFDPFTADSSPNRQAATISGARGAQAGQNGGATDADDDDAPLAPPALPGEPDLTPTAEMKIPQPRQEGAGQPVMGGAGGALSGAATQASQGGAEGEGQPTYADAKADAMYASGGGSGRGRGGDDKGPDLSGLLAQFLPQAQEEQPTNGILDFGGGREPASEGLDGSLLGSDADLFKRVHETYQDQARKGRIGKI
jgi:hypothetical protein